MGWIILTAAAALFVGVATGAAFNERSHRRHPDGVRARRLERDLRIMETNLKYCRDQLESVWFGSTVRYLERAIAERDDEIVRLERERDEAIAKGDQLLFGMGPRPTGQEGRR